MAPGDMVFVHVNVLPMTLWASWYPVSAGHATLDEWLGEIARKYANHKCNCLPFFKAKQKKLLIIVV